MNNSVYRERLEEYMLWCVDTGSEPTQLNWIGWNHAHGYLLKDMVMSVARFIATTLPVAFKKYTNIDIS